MQPRSLTRSFADGQRPEKLRELAIETVKEAVQECSCPWIMAKKER